MWWTERPLGRFARKASAIASAAVKQADKNSNAVYEKRGVMHGKASERHFENGGVIFTALDSTDIVRQMREYHNTSAVTSAALGAFDGGRG